MEREFLIHGENCFTETELSKFVIVNNRLSFSEANSYRSNSFREYVLSDEILKILREKNIEPRKADSENAYAISDNNPGEAGSNWFFYLDQYKKGTFDLRVSLSFSVEIKIRKRGMVFYPHAEACSSNCTCVSPNSRSANFRMFKTLIDNNADDVPEIAKRMAASPDGQVVVNWTELGLGGLRTLKDIFYNEFAKGNEAVQKLTKETIFFPNPYNDSRYITEQVQSILFDVWEEQLKEYRNKLYSNFEE